MSSCPHWNADDFVETVDCPHCHKRVEVEFHTCSCYTGAHGECPECEQDIHLTGKETDE